MKNIVIFGATSAIAQEVAKIYADAHAGIYLVGRNPEKLAAIAQDLKVRGASKLGYIAADLEHCDKHYNLWNQALECLGEINIVLIAHGILGDHAKAIEDYAEAERIFSANFLSAVSLLTVISNYFPKLGKGTIAVISSVAGDRGRQSNYIYGAAKAGLDAYLSGLRNRLYHFGVHVLTVKPGFVDTPMTQNFKKGPLWATSSGVGYGIYRSIEASRNIQYLPWFWYYIMLIIRNIPENFFKRLKL